MGHASSVSTSRVTSRRCGTRPTTGARARRLARRSTARSINTASASGTFLANPGQANYGSAKAAIAALTLVAAGELVADRGTRQRDRAGCAHAPDRRRARDGGRADAQAGRPRRVRPVRPGATSRRSSPIWPARTARSPAGSSPFRAARSPSSWAGAPARRSATDGAWTQEILERELGTTNVTA